MQPPPSHLSQQQQQQQIPAPPPGMLPPQAYNYQSAAALQQMQQQQQQRAPPQPQYNPSPYNPYPPSMQSLPPNPSYRFAPPQMYSQSQSPSPSPYANPSASSLLPHQLLSPWGSSPSSSPSPYSMAPPSSHPSAYLLHSLPPSHPYVLSSPQPNMPPNLGGPPPGSLSSLASLAPFLSRSHVLPPPPTPITATCLHCHQRLPFPLSSSIDRVTCPSCHTILSTPDVLRAAEEAHFYDTLSPYTSHFSSPHSALVWLSQAKPTRTGKLAVPRAYRWPKSTAGKGGYADAFVAMGLQLRRNDTASGHWHCLGEEERVLTCEGFVGLDEVVRGGRWLGLRFACYSERGRRLEYHPASHVIVQPRARRTMVAFGRSGRGKGVEGGGGDDEASREEEDGDERAHDSRVSLLVTEEHDVYVDGEGKGRYAKVKAGEVADCTDPHTSIRMLAAAEHGVHVQPGGPALPFLQALDLSPHLTSVFVELYGFWLGSGSLDSAAAAVRFQVRGVSDQAWLHERLHELGLHDSDLRRCTELDGTCVLLVLQPRWFAYFHDEYGAAGSSSPFSAHPVPPAQRGARSYEVGDVVEVRVQREGCEDCWRVAVVTEVSCSGHAFHATLSDGQRVLNVSSADLTAHRAVDVATAAAVDLPDIIFSRAAAEAELDAQGWPGEDKETSGVEGDTDSDSEASDDISIVHSSVSSLDAEPLSPRPHLTESNRWLFSWVLRSLDQAHIRRLIAGYQRATSSSSSHAQQLLTSSPRLRDELIVALLHGGYTAVYELHSPHRWLISYADSASTSPFSCSSSSIAAARPVFRCSTDVQRVPHVGRAWCVQVPHGLIVVQHTPRSASSSPTSSPPLLPSPSSHPPSPTSSRSFSSHSSSPSPTTSSSCSSSTPLSCPSRALIVGNCWYVDRASVPFASMQAGLLKRWKESPGFTADAVIDDDDAADATRVGEKRDRDGAGAGEDGGGGGGGGGGEGGEGAEFLERSFRDGSEEAVAYNAELGEGRRKLKAKLEGGEGKKVRGGEDGGKEVKGVGVGGAAVAGGGENEGTDGRAREDDAASSTPPPVLTNGKQPEGEGGGGGGGVGDGEKARHEQLAGLPHSPSPVVSTDSSTSSPSVSVVSSTTTMSSAASFAPAPAEASEGRKVEVEGVNASLPSSSPGL